MAGHQLSSKRHGKEGKVAGDEDADVIKRPISFGCDRSGKVSKTTIDFIVVVEIDVERRRGYFLQALGQIGHTIVFFSSSAVLFWQMTSATEM